jgi:hypothetical protein
MTITISSDEPSMIDRVINLLHREKVPFDITPELADDDAVRTAAIRERLRRKFVVSGEWDTMDEEDRLDAALFEGMMYDNEQSPIEYHSEADSRAFYQNQKKQNHAV